MGGKSLPKLYALGNLGIFDKGTLDTLRMRDVGGDTLTLPYSTDTVTVTNFAAADFSPTAGRNYIIGRSTVNDAHRSILRLKPATVDHWAFDSLYMRLIDIQPDTLTCNGCRDGGGNLWAK
jgi:hypothetical protein